MEMTHEDVHGIGIDLGLMEAFAIVVARISNEFPVFFVSAQGDVAEVSFILPGLEAHGSIVMSEGGTSAILIPSNRHDETGLIHSQSWDNPDLEEIVETFLRWKEELSILSVEN